MLFILRTRRDLNLLKSQWKWANREELGTKKRRMWALCSRLQWMKKGVQAAGKRQRSKEVNRGQNLMQDSGWAVVSMTGGGDKGNSHLVWTGGVYSKFCAPPQSNPFSHSLANAFLKLFLFCSLWFFAFPSFKWEFTGRKARMKEKPHEKPCFKKVILYDLGKGPGCTTWEVTLLVRKAILKAILLETLYQ